MQLSLPGLSGQTIEPHAPATVEEWITRTLRAG
jgi:hypothetical protein